MYIPKYSITTEILKNIGLVEVAKEVIENAPLVPGWEAKFREDAALKAAHYGTALEGNDLTMGEARKIFEGGVETVDQAEGAGVYARARDVQEVINYRNVLKLIEGCRQGGKITDRLFGYTRELLLEIHRLATERIIPPVEAGKFRTAQVLRGSGRARVPVLLLRYGAGGTYWRE